MPRPKLKILAMLVWCGICHSLPLRAGSLAIQVYTGNHEPLPDAVVYLLTERSASMTTPGERHIEIEQKNKMFNPFVTVIPIGSRVMFPNRDGIGHHVYSFSPPRKFQLPLSEHESTETVVFDQPGMVTVGCNIHDWMVAYIYVVPTPFYAKSDAAGQAVIENLPEGEYDLHITHPGIKSVKDLTQRVNTAVSGKLEFTLDLKPEYLWRPKPQTDEETY